MLYVLDLDDTLYLEQDYVRSGFCEVDKWLAEHRNINNFFKEAWKRFISGLRGNIFDSVLEDMGIFDKELVRLLVQIYREHLPDISLQSDAINFFKNHNKEDLAIITDGYAKAQWAKIETLNLKKYVDNIIVTDDLGKEFWKPDPRSYILAQGSRQPYECVYIGDNPLKDFKAPLELGWAPSFRIRRRNSLHFDLDTPEKKCMEINLLTDKRLQQ
jgi:putative hydrolase of the HAD superfamily